MKSREVIWVNDGSGAFGGRYIEVTDENRYICEITPTRLGHKIRFPYWQLYDGEGGTVEMWKFGSRERAETWARETVERDKQRRRAPRPPIHRFNLS
jgi:hypothetical protein